MGTATPDIASLDRNPLPLLYEPGREPAGRRGRGTIAPSRWARPPSAAEMPGKTFGFNNEKLPKKLQVALQLLLTMYVNEGQVARRDEVRKSREARAFWKGLQYEYYSESGKWHLPWEVNDTDASGSPDDEPRYAFVTNYYQAFGLSIIAVLSQDVPAVRTWPQSPDQPEDVTTAEAATGVIELVERNNRMQDLLVDEAFYLWCDGKVGGYVRYVVDGSRWGYYDCDDMQGAYQKMGEDEYQCPACRTATPTSNYLGVCQHCGTPLEEQHLSQAPMAMVPRVQQTTKQPNGAEVVDIVGALELKTPPWANQQHQFPYLIWDQLAHRAKLKASFPWAAKSIAGGAIAPEDTQAQYERTAAITLVAGGDTEPVGAAGDLTQNLVTFRQAWLRPWAFELLEDDALIEELYEAFPTGAYVAFAGDVYCASRNESMDDHWRVMHALPGDGQSRPGVGSSFISVQQRYNTLANLVVETVEHGIPSIWASPAVVDFDAIRESFAEPGAVYQSPAPAGMRISDGFFETKPAAVSRDAVEHMNMLSGQVGQFLTGAFPALFGGEMEGNDTAAGYQMARDQAMGRIGLVWRRMKTFHADLMLLSVDVFRKNRPDDVQAPVFGAGGKAKARWIRTADLKGNVVCYPESENQYPTLWAQQRAVLLQLIQSPGPDDAAGAGQQRQPRVDQAPDRPRGLPAARRRRQEQADGRDRPAARRRPAGHRPAARPARAGAGPRDRRHGAADAPRDRRPHPGRPAAQRRRRSAAR
jgi:hypothetical protein